MAHKLKTLVAAGMKGINSDIAPWDLSAEYITDGENFRITADKIISVGSYERWSAPVPAGYLDSNLWYGDPTSTFTGAVTTGTVQQAADDLLTLYFSKTTFGGADYTDYLESLQVGDTFTEAAKTWTIGAIDVQASYVAITVTPSISIYPLAGIYTFTFYNNAVDVFGHLLAVSTASSYFYIAAGNDSVLVYDGGTTPATAWHDITSAAGYAGIGVDGELNWTSAMLGSIPLVNNPAVYPEYWSPQATTQVLQPLEFSAGVTFAARPTPIQAEVIRTHKNYVFLLNLVEGATELPSSYRWSHPADNNGLPPSFDETDLNYIAGKAQIGGNSGRLLDGRTLRDSFVLYSEYAVNILDESYDEFVWRRRELSSSIGLLNRNSLVEVKGTHYFIGDGDIYKNDGNSVDSIIHNRLKKRFNSQASAEYFDRSYAVRNNALKEIWFCIPEVGSEFPDTAFVYNWRDDSWAIQKIPATIAHAAYGAQIDPPATFDDYIGTGITFDDMIGVPFDGQTRTPMNETVVGIENHSGALLILDPNVTQEADLDSYIERIGYPLDGALMVNTVVRLYPHMIGSKDVSIKVGSQQFAGAPIVWEQAVTFNPETDRKIDVRTTGMYLCWRIESIGTGQFEYTGMDIEYSPSGVR